MFGYEIKNKSVPEMYVILESVMTKCAYSFQLLNDLEPFTAIKQNIRNKQNHNFDFEKKRKNLIVARLYQKCSLTDKEIMQKYSGKRELIDVILKLIQKYHIEDIVINEVETSKREITEELHGLSKATNNTECLNDFLFFVNYILDLCYLRVERLE